MPLQKQRHVRWELYIYIYIYIYSYGRMHDVVCSIPQGKLATRLNRFYLTNRFNLARTE